QGSGIEDLNALARSAICERLGAQIVGALEKFKAEAAQRAAAMPNSPQLILAAQTQLIGLGCELPGKPDGTLNDATKSALARFMTVKGRATDDLTVTTSLVDDLAKQTDRVCPLECKANEVVKGNKCVAIEKPARAPVVTSRKKEDENEAPPHARQQAIVRPMSGGGGGGRGGTKIGVGF